LEKELPASTSRLWGIAQYDALRLKYKARFLRCREKSLNKLLQNVVFEGLVEDKQQRVVTAVSDETQPGIMDSIYKSNHPRVDKEEQEDKTKRMIEDQREDILQIAPRKQSGEDETSRTGAIHASHLIQSQNLSLSDLSSIYE